MAEIPVLARLTASDLFLLQCDESGWSSDIGGLAIPDGTRLALVSATTDSDGEQRLLQEAVGAAAVSGGR
jgi:hypothetical protein